MPSPSSVRTTGTPPFGPLIRFHRKRAGLTQLGLARLAGVGKTLIFDIEKGKATVRVDGLLRVLATLNIQLDWSSPLRDVFMEEQADAASPHPRSR